MFRVNKGEKMENNARYYKIIMLSLSIFLLIMAGGQVQARENMEKQIDTIIDVLSSPDTNDQELQNKKSAIRNILNRKQHNSGGSLVDDLIRVYLGNGSRDENQQDNSGLLNKGVEQIIGIISPDASWEEREQQKKTIITILNGAYKKKPANTDDTHNGTNDSQDGGGDNLDEDLSAFVEVSASAELGYQFEGDNAVDGEENTEWVAPGGQGQWILLKWSKPVYIHTVMLQGRRQDMRAQIWSSDLIFSDGSIVGFGALNAAELRTVTVDKGNITWLKYFVREGQNNVGLSEILVKGSRSGKHSGKKPNVSLVPANLAQRAVITVSGYTKKKHSGKKAVDRNPKTEWVARGSKNQWITLQWNRPVTINHIKLWGRHGDSDGRKHDGFFLFSDGVVIPVSGLSGNASKTVKCNRSGISWVKYYIRRAQHNAGLAEMEVVGVMPKNNIVVPNLAQSATVQVSDQQRGNFRSEYINDRRLDTEWVARGHRDKWVSLQWHRPVNIATMTVTEGKGLQDSRIDDAMVILSDGSLVSIGGLEPGQPKTVEINRKGLRWVRFFIREGRGKIGLAEIEVKEQ